MSTDVGQDHSILDRLWARYGGAAGAVGYSRLPGRSHRVYACQAESGPALVIRLAAGGRSRFGVEAELARRLSDLAVPVPMPEIRFVGDLETDSGTVAAMVQTRAVGRTLRDYAEGANRTDAHRATARAGAVLRMIHQVRADGFGPLDGNLRGEHAELGGWFVDALEPKAAQAISLAPDSAARITAAMDLLAAHRELLDASAPGLLHGDFSPDNVLVDAEGAICAVLDWEAVKSGPPELDIGWWDCFFEAPATPAAELLRGYADPGLAASERLRAIRHLTVLRVMIGHFSWCASVGSTDGAAEAERRLARELGTAESWRLA